MRRISIYFVFSAIALMGAIFGAPSVHAESVQIKPLQNATELGKGEKKKGFVDVTNAGSASVDVRLYVSGFRQVNDKGDLSFFDDEQIRQGIKLDYDHALIGPRQTLRLFYQVDGTKLPTGDVFAAVFADAPTRQGGVTHSGIRVGSLLFVTNQTPGSRHAEITELSVPFWQTGDTLEGTVAVKNPSTSQTTGFFPKMNVQLDLWGGNREFRGPLIFAGNTRSMPLAMPTGSKFGLYAVTVRANDASKTAYVFLVTGWWRVNVIVIVLLLIIAGFLLWRRKTGRQAPLRLGVRHRHK